GDDVPASAPRGAARDRGHARRVSARDELPGHPRFDPRTTGVEPDRRPPAMSTAGSDDYVLLTRLADEFAERYRRGERPSLAEYVDRYPHLAADIREVFPALTEVELARTAGSDAGFTAPARTTGWRSPPA